MTTMICVSSLAKEPLKLKETRYRLGTVIVAVMQKYRRELKHAGLENLPIGFAIYEVEPTDNKVVCSLGIGSFLPRNHCQVFRPMVFMDASRQTSSRRTNRAPAVLRSSTFERYYRNGMRLHSAHLGDWPVPRAAR